MVSYRNVKPSIGDAVRTMFTTVNKNNTKPTGTAVLESDEGFVLQAPTGRTITWDGEAAVQFREDLDSAEAAVSAASEALFAADQRLEQADERLIENDTILADADQRIIDAEALAAEAKALAEQGGGTPSLDNLVPGDGPVDPLVAEKLAGAVGVYDTLIVTEQAILNHATLLGTTVVEELHVTKTLRGRDAILDGTLDVAQLNVTEDLSAAVVNAMTANIKNLVVTEDAILNRVTVIEGIVTEELVANRINLQTLGGDLMQEAALTVAGPGGVVQLSGSGYQAWNAQNVLTVNLDGMDNLITGQLKTAATGTRAELSTRLASGSTNPEFGTSALDFFVGNEDHHGAIWYDSGANRFLNIYAMSDLGFSAATATGLTIHRDTDSIQFNGQIANSRAMQKGHLSGGYIGAGGFISNATVTFPTPFAVAPRVFCQAQSENATDLVVTVRSRSRTGFVYNVKNLGTNNATGDFRFDWFAIA